MRTVAKLYYLAKRILKHPLATPGSGGGTAPGGGAGRTPTFHILGF
jgi:hypothetical protein